MKSIVKNIKFNFKIEFLLIIYFIYNELILKIASKSNFSIGFFIFVIPISISISFLISFIIKNIRNRNICFRVLFFILLFTFIIYASELNTKSTFGNYYDFSYMLIMSKNVFSNFLNMVFSSLYINIIYLILLLLPIIFYLYFKRKIMRIFKNEKSSINYNVIAVSICLIFFWIMNFIGRNFYKDLYVNNWSADETIEQFGLSNSLILETKYLLFGFPKRDAKVYGDYIKNATDVENKQNDKSKLVSESKNNDTSGDTNDENEQSIKQIQNDEYNKYDIDFEKLNDTTNNDVIKALNGVFQTIIPTNKNEYTGYFKDKMLIQITAEAFSQYVISEELTPTLYKLSHEGFIFDNFYLPNYGQSTTGGEFASMCGLIPRNLNGARSMQACINNYMPFTLGNIFKKKDYNTFAYHASYDYYDRNLTHPNLGYDYRSPAHGIDYVLGKKDDRGMYYDSILFENTFNDYIDDYIKKGKKFHVYYMTVSGHAPYDGTNARSTYYYDLINEYYPDSSEAIKMYLASQIELEYAVSSLIDMLKEKDLLDDVVISIVPDHYPYKLARMDKDYFVELSSIEDTENDPSRYKSIWILWSNNMETKNIDTYCSIVDMLPTLLNLFDLKFDSRLLSGRDVFATNYEIGVPTTNMPIIIFPYETKISFMTREGYYDGLKNEWIPHDMVEVDENYLELTKSIAKLKYDLAYDIVESNYYSCLKNIISAEDKKQ